MELKKEIITHLIPSLIFFLVSLIFLWSKLSVLNIFFLFSGTIIGTFIIDIDHFIYCFITHPNSPSGQQATSYLKNNQYSKAFFSVFNTHTQHHQLTFHSATFIPLWALFSLFIITSTTSIFAQSLVLAGYLHLLKDIWDEQNSIPQNLNKWLFWQIKTPVSQKFQKYFVYSSTTAFLILLFIFIS